MSQRGVNFKILKLMQKEKQIKSYQRKTKSGKVVTVKAHTAKYTAADMAAEALRKKAWCR